MGCVIERLTYSRRSNIDYWPLHRLQWYFVAIYSNGSTHGQLLIYSWHDNWTHFFLENETIPMIKTEIHFRELLLGLFTEIISWNCFEILQWKWYVVLNVTSYSTTCDWYFFEKLKLQLFISLKILSYWKSCILNDFKFKHYFLKFFIFQTNELCNITHSMFIIIILIKNWNYPFDDLQCMSMYDSISCRQSFCVLFTRKLMLRYILFKQIIKSFRQSLWDISPLWLSCKFAGVKFYKL